MVCEVPGSDVDVFTDALKRVMEDVRSVPEEKGEDGGLLGCTFMQMYRF